jgi:hypothetical protein
MLVIRGFQAKVTLKTLARLNALPATYVQNVPTTEFA